MSQIRNFVTSIKNFIIKNKGFQGILLIKRGYFEPFALGRAMSVKIIEMETTKIMINIASVLTPSDTTAIGIPIATPKTDIGTVNHASTYQALFLDINHRAPYSS